MKTLIKAKKSKIKGNKSKGKGNNAKYLELYYKPGRKKILKLSDPAKLKAEGIRSFGIPAFKDIFGKMVCFGADKCAPNCYAQMGFYKMLNTMILRQDNFDLSKNDNFVDNFSALFIASGESDLLFNPFRWFDSGDIYSIEFLSKMIKIADKFPLKTFYAYTKSFPIVCLELMPSNLVIIQSLGGKYDSLIDYDYPIAKVFLKESDLLAEGFVNCSKSDRLAIDTAVNGNKKIGLIYHGDNIDQEEVGQGFVY